MTERAIPPKWRARIERELKEGESLLWCGRPRPVFFTKMTTVFAISGVPWTACAVVIFLEMIESRELGYVPYIFGIPFFAAGIAMVLTPLGMYLVAMRTVYAVTSQRVIIFNRYVPRIFSIPREKIGGTYRIEYSDGTGDVVIKEFTRRKTNQVLVKVEYEFQRIAAPQMVEKIIQAFYRRTDRNEVSTPQSNTQNKFELSADLSLQLREAIARELEAEESVAWAATPKPRLLSVEAYGEFYVGIALTVLASAGTLIAVFYKSPAFQKVSDLWKLFPGVFALAGIAIILQPIFAYWRILHGVYVITNRRAIIITGGRNTSFLSFKPEEFSALDVEDQLDGTSNLILVKEVSRNLDSDATERHGFMRIENIDEAREALSLIERPEKISEVSGVIGVS